MSSPEELDWVLAREVVIALSQHVVYAMIVIDVLHRMAERIL